MDSYNDSNLNLSQEYCDNLYDSPSKCLSNYPLLTTIVASGTVLTAAGLINPKSRKVLVPAIKYIGKQQLKLFAGIGVLSLATIYSKNVNSSDNKDDSNDLIVL